MTSRACATCSRSTSPPRLPAIGAESALPQGDRAKQQVDLAAVDIHMPGEDGLSLARHLRERYPGIAIVS